MGAWIQMWVWCMVIENDATSARQNATSTHERLRKYTRNQDKSGGTRVPDEIHSLVWFHTDVPGSQIHPHARLRPDSSDGHHGGTLCANVVPGHGHSHVRQMVTAMVHVSQVRTLHQSQTSRLGMDMFTAPATRPTVPSSVLSFTCTVRIQ